jgi:hypothetical protein
MDAGAAWDLGAFAVRHVSIVCRAFSITRQYFLAHGKQFFYTFVKFIKTIIFKKKIRKLTQN